MIHFAPITLETKELFRQYASMQIRNCDAAFANIFCWQQTYHSLYAAAEGFLIVKYRTEGRRQAAYMLFTPEFTEDGMQRIVPMLEQDAASEQNTLKITGLPACAAELLRSAFGPKFACACNRDSADYIYNAADLRELPGRKYQPKRNHINRFNDFYNWQYEPLTARHKEECLQLENKWQSHHTDDESISAERLAIIRAFDNFDALGLRGGALRIDGRLAAFTYGSPINEEVFDVHAEKADTSFDGIFPAINRLFAQTIPQHYKFVNREEDMGLEGLRRSKMSYHPAQLESKFTALVLDNSWQQIRELWMDAFGDAREFADEFLVERSRYDISTFAEREGERVVSMLHSVPFTDSAGHTFAYIYGVATAPTHRRRGLATNLIRRVLNDVGRLYDAAILIPADSKAKDFYRKAGFADTQTELLFETEFDFGSGTPEGDKAMIFTAENIELTSPLRLYPHPQNESDEAAYLEPA